MGLLDLLGLKLPEPPDGAGPADTKPPGRAGFGTKPSPAPPPAKGKAGFGNNPHALPGGGQPGFGHDPKDLTPRAPGKAGGGPVAPVTPPKAGNKPARRESTPYGELVFPYTDSETDAWLDVVKAAVRQAKAVEGFHPTFKAALATFTQAEKKLTPMGANDPAKVAADVTSSTTHEVAQDAATSAASRDALDGLVLHLKALQYDVGEAHENLRLALQDVKIADKRAEAVTLKEKAEHEEKVLDTVLEGVGSAIEAFAHLEMGPYALAKPVWDTVTSLIKLFHENPMAEKAKEMLADARVLEAENLEDKVRQAERHLRHAEELMRDVLPKSLESAQNYQRQVDRATEAFDRTSRGSFRFGELRRGLEAARKTNEAAVHARELIATLSLTLSSVYDPSVPRGGDAAGGKAFREAVEASIGKIELQVTVTLEVMEKLLVIYPLTWKAAEKALQSAPGTGRARSG